MLAMIKIKEAYDYDTFHLNSEKSYRIITNLNRKNGEHFLCASSPLPLASFLKDSYNAIEKSTSVYFSSDEVAGNDKSCLLKGLM
jgi:putative ABC transport system permease protein